MNLLLAPNLGSEMKLLSALNLRSEMNLLSSLHLSQALALSLKSEMKLLSVIKLMSPVKLLLSPVSRLSTLNSCHRWMSRMNLLSPVSLKSLVSFFVSTVDIWSSLRLCVSSEPPVRIKTSIAFEPFCRLNVFLMNSNNKLSLNTALNPGDEKCLENSITFLLASNWLAKQYVLLLC